MIITKISRLGTYVGVNPHFATLIDFLEKNGTRKFNRRFDCYRW
ncbi:beta-galactosidase subunit beta [Streptococcus pneumoniae]|nr:beta-galactosidase subunit beta [Streptococcus pneumoniae]